MELDFLDNQHNIKNKIFRIGNRGNKKRKNFLTRAVRKSRFLRRNPCHYKKMPINENSITVVNEDS